MTGLLCGLAEAIPIVHYDWWMSDWAPQRVLVGLLWVLAIVAVNLGAWAVAGVMGQRWTLMGVVPLVGVIAAGRVVQADRFSMGTLVLPALALGVSLLPRRASTAWGVAACVSVFALWGRVPSSAVPIADRALALVPGLVLAAVVAFAAGRKAPAVRVSSAGIVGVGVVWLAATAWIGRTSTAAPARPPSVLFILVDTLRLDHVAPYADVDTPSTRRIAAEGLRFDNAITVIPKTTQSVAAFQTGRYPINNGVRTLNDRLEGGQLTLAEHLQHQGWRTGAVVHNPWVRRGRGFEQGFDQFWSFDEIERAWGPLRYTGVVMALDTFVTHRVRTFDPNTNATDSTDRALAWLNETPDNQPFYLYVHYFDPHWPYRPPGVDAENRVNNIHETRWSKGDLIFNNPLRDDENKEAIGLYGQEVDHNADEISRLLDWLDAHGRAEDTLVVFTADHGHHLGDHEYWYHHGAFLYEPGLRIPLLVRAPGRAAPGSVESLQFRSIDLLPTLLDWMALPVPKEVDGETLDTLRAVGAPPALLESDQIFFKSNKRRYIKGTLGKVRGVRDGRWKLHLTPRKGGGVWELYDLEADPNELNNLADAPPADAPVAELLRALRDHVPAPEREELEARGQRWDSLAGGGAATQATQSDPETEAEISDEDANMLRSMGYMD